LVFATVGSSGLFLNAAPILLATRLLVGVATGMMITCRTSLIAVSYTGRARARMTGYTFGVGAVSAVILVLVSGAAAHLSWRAPFALHAVIGAVFIIPVLALKAIPSIGVGADSVARGALETFRHLKPAATAYCLIFVVVLIANLFSIQITFLLVQAGITSPATIANVCVGNVLAIALSNAVYGRIEARLGVVRTTQSVFACLAIGASLCASSLSLPQFIAGTFIGGIGVGLGVPAAINPIMRRTSLILAARALSIATTVMYLGGATAPVLYAPIRVAVGLHGVYYFAAIAILFGLIMFRVRSPITGT
jgi:MFS family permease